MNRSRPADILLDRDGVIVHERAGYLLAPDQLELLPGAAAAIARLRAAGHRVFVITNQSAVGRGLLDGDTLALIHERLDSLVREGGGEISGYFVCPHHPGVGCDCRKPRPGLLYAARDHAGVDLSAAVLVGDQLSDVQAAAAAGCRAVLVLTGQGCAALPHVDDSVAVVADLDAAANLILRSPVPC